MKLCSFFFLCFLTTHLSAQTLEAVYAVNKKIAIQLDGTVKSVTLPYKGFLYKSGERYISYDKPLYLQQYATGSISVQISTNRYVDYGLLMDTIQNIKYKNLDSMLFRHRFDMSGKDNIKENYVSTFEPGFQNWVFLKETKTINGLKCQRAQMFFQEKMQWDVWVCADVPAQAGPDNIFGMPGLVVEAYSPITDVQYLLESYKTGVDIPEHIFWPDEFNQPFITRRPIKKVMVAAPKTKGEKLNDIINQ